MKTAAELHADAKRLHEQGRFSQAAALYQDALREPGNAAQIWHDLGICHQQAGDRREARACFEKSLAADPALALNRFTLAQLDMMETGFSPASLAAYEARFSVPGANSCGLPFPRWQGEDLSGKSLLAWWEQGVGDIIMFASLLPGLAEHYRPERITLALPPKMAPLFARSFPGMSVVADGGRIAPHDFMMPLGDALRYGLPHYAPAKHPPFLKADAARVPDLRAKLDRLAPGKRKIGIGWATTNAVGADIRRIELPLWRPIFEVPDCLFFSLQHGAGAVAELERFRRDTGLPVYVDAGFDPTNIDALATCAAAMDEIISAQNALVHLGGGLGLPTTLMLPFASDFRWLLGRADSPFYASVAIERQDAPLDWSGCISRTARRLKEAVALPRKNG